MVSKASKIKESQERLSAANDASDDVISDQAIEWKQRINDKLLDILDLSLIETIGEEKARAEIRQTVNRLLAEESAPLSLRQRQSVVKQIEDDVMGLGPLEPLIADKTVSDILVNGFDTIFVERHGKLESTNLRFTSHSHLMNIIDRIVSAVGRRVDESSPMVDARLKDGSRVNVIIPPLALDGAMLSIRRFAVERLLGKAYFAVFRSPGIGKRIHPHEPGEVIRKSPVGTYITERATVVVLKRSAANGEYRNYR